VASLPTTAADIVAAVSSGTVTASEVLEKHLAAIAARETDVHAFNLITADAARQHAARIDADVADGKPVGALAGVPLALKDNMCTRHHGRQN